MLLDADRDIDLSGAKTTDAVPTRASSFSIPLIIRQGEGERSVFFPSLNSKYGEIRQMMRVREKKKQREENREREDVT